MLLLNLYNLESLVKFVLEEYPDTRKNDDILIFRVYKELNEDAMIRELFCEIMFNRKEYGFPPFGSVLRTRRKVFEKHPYLKPKKITKLRKKKEREYREYAISK